MPKVLLTSVFKPFDTFEDGSNMMDLYAGRLTKGQDIFTYECDYPPIPLYLIAQNITAPSVVLENPSWAAFTRELAKGYDYVGIHFAASLFFDRVLRMCRHIRQVSPDTRIILGGYGVACLGEDFQEEAELRSLVDHVCYGEGVRFVRELLGEPTDRPIRQHMPPTWVRVLGVKYAFNNLVAALGCNAGCEFCATSAFFRYRKVQLASPQELWAAMKIYLRERDYGFLWVFDEDFFASEDYAREFGRVVASDPDIKPEEVHWGGFASVRALSKFTAEELARMGVEALWIGIESDMSPLPKRQGKPIQQVFDELHGAGIVTVGSYVVGWDFHTPENISADIDHVVALNPTYSQVSSLMPCPGTRLWKQLRDSGRLRTDGFRWKTFNLYSVMHEHVHMTDEQVHHWVDETQKRLFETNGPTVLRAFEVYLKGVRSLKDNPDPRIQGRVKRLRKWCRLYSLGLLSVKAFAPSRAVREKADRLHREYREVFGAPGPVARVTSVLLLGVAAWLKLRRRLGPSLRQPAFRRTEYHGAVS